MARDMIRLVGEHQPAFLLKHPERRNGNGHDGGLGVFGEREMVFGAFRHQAEEILAERVGHFLKDLARGGRSEEQTSELQSTRRNTNAGISVKQKNIRNK